MIQINVLENRINQLKQELLQIVKATGLNSHETICCSRELDKLITIYQNTLIIDESRNM